MQELSKRIEDRQKREIERLKGGNVLDKAPSDHAGEAQDPITGRNLGDGTGPLASTGASGHLGNPVQGDLAKRGGPSTGFPSADTGTSAKPAGDGVKTNVKGGAGPKDPTA